MTDVGKIAALEALLFLHGESLSIQKIAAYLHMDEADVRVLCEAYTRASAVEDRGCMLIQKGDAYQLVTKPAFGSLLEEFAKQDLKEDLTPAAIETLSLVAYFGPLTRAHIDFVRGVNSSFTLRNLLMRGLIERKATKGNTYAYEVTFDFLKHMGISKQDDLPGFSEHLQLRDKLFTQQQEEIKPTAV